MNLAQFPRKRYTTGSTPIEHLSRLSTVLGGPQIYIKRDDLLGLASGGNKTRKLEFLMANALKNGSDTIITCGAVQSNHCRLTLAAAVKEGLKCHLVLEERVPDSYNPQSSGNNFLYHLLGVEGIRVVPGGSDMLVEMQKIAQELVKKGRKPYIIPGGGSNEIGSLGYVSCAEEVLAQLFDHGLNISTVVCASGSGGTHAGLVVGFYGNNAGIPVVGINVSRPKDVQETLIHDLAVRVGNHIGLKHSIPRDVVTCFDDYVGPGYSLPTVEMVDAVNLLAKTEGILLDPVYTGKAMSGLISLIRNGHFQKNDNVLFVHTGGSPALYAYTSLFFEAETALASN